MEKTTIALKRILVGEPQETPAGVSAAADTMTDIGNIYKDTCTFEDGDPTKIEHKAEGKRNPIISISVPGTSTLAFSLMDVSTENLETWLGGDVVDQIWTEPETPVFRKASLLVEPLIGLNLLIPEATVSVKKRAEYNENGIFLLDFEVVPTLPLGMEDTSTAVV